MMRDQSREPKRHWTQGLAVCGEWMPHARERCARRVGHGGASPGHGTGHRTRYALDNNRVAKRFGFQR